MRERLAILGSYSTVVQAEIVKGRIEEAGIAVILADGTESAQTGPVALPSWTSVHLLVRTEDLDRARRIVATPAIPPGPDQ